LSGYLDGHESASPMAAVAEWFVLRLTTTAQSNRFLTHGQTEFVAQVIDNFDRGLNDERSIFAAANHDGISHNVPSS
jgi:hypothetical protein